MQKPLLDDAAGVPPWSRDVSEDITDEIARRCGMDGFDVPPFLIDFVDRHGSERPVCTENPICVDEVTESRKLAG